MTKFVLFSSIARRWELKLPKWESAQPRRPRKIGILAGTFEDGSLSLYVVPDPEDVRPPEHDAALPVFGERFFFSAASVESLSRIVRLPEPVLRIEHEGTSCWSLDWANSEVIAVGFTNGEPQDLGDNV